MLFFLREGSVINPKLYTALDGYYFVKERCQLASYLKGWLTQKTTLNRARVDIYRWPIDYIIITWSRLSSWSSWKVMESDKSDREEWRGDGSLSAVFPQISMSLKLLNECDADDEDIKWWYICKWVNIYSFRLEPFGTYWKPFVAFWNLQKPPGFFGTFWNLLKPSGCKLGT